jgi:hypothetical protein
MPLEMSHTHIRVLLLISAFGATHLHAQSEPHHGAAFSYEVDFGGEVPAPTTAYEPYSPSVMVGGGVSLPLGKWAGLGSVPMDLCFGTIGQTQTIQVSGLGADDLHGWINEFQLFNVGSAAGTPGPSAPFLLGSALLLPFVLRRVWLSTVLRRARVAMRVPARCARVGLTFALASAACAWGGNIAADDAARLVQGVNASVRYQLYQSNPASAPQKLDIAMAPVLGVIKNGLIAGVSTSDLLTLHQAAVTNASFVVNSLSPAEQVGNMIDFMKSAIDPEKWPLLGFDLVKAEITAYSNAANSGQLSRTEVIGPLQPTYVQDLVNKYFTTQMADAHDIAATNSTFAQNFDQIFHGDLGASIKDNAATVLNSNLNIPDYFRVSANVDGTLSVDVAGLKNVYAGQSAVLNLDALAALNLTSQVDQAQQSAMQGGASASQIAQSVPPALRSTVQTKYQAIQQDLATASAGITLTSNLLKLTGADPKTTQEITTYGNAGVQLASGMNELMNGAPTLASSLVGAGNVVGAVLAVYGLLQGGPSRDSAVQAQLAALGQQITQLRTQMNARFDVIDTNLNTIYQTINTAFNTIIPNLAALTQSLANLEGNLNRFEQNFYSLEIAGFLSNLDSAVTGCIAFQQVYGANNPLPFQLYAGPNGCENTFYIWGTQNAATLATIPGSRAYDDAHIYQELLQPPTGSPDLANFVNSANINYLSQFPYQRFGLSPLSGQLLANPSVWEISAEGDAQLARENPAYDAALLPSRNADIAGQGIAIQSAIHNVTLPVAGGHPLFDNLFSNYHTALNGLQSKIASFQGNFTNTAIQAAVQNLVPKGVTRCDGGVFQYYTTTTATVAASADLINRVPPAYLAAQGAGMGSLRVCMDAVHTNFHSGGPTGQLANVQVNIHFKYTPQGQAEQDAYEISWVSDLSFIDPYTDFYAYLRVWYYWQTPFGPPYGSQYGNWLGKTAAGASQTYQNQPLLSTATVQVNSAAVGPIIAQFSTASSDIRNAATILAGAKSLIENYILLGLPRSFKANDYMRSLIYGSQRLPGRVPNGQDDITTTINSLANQPSIDIVSAINPRVTSLQNTVNSILTSIDSNQFQEYDDALNSVLQTLNNGYTAKVANSISTPTGSNVKVQTPQNISVAFTGVFQTGVTVTTAAQPAAAFGVPGGFIITPQVAFDVETTAVYAGPVTTCFSVPSINDPATFATLVVYHSEAGVLVDRTVSSNFATRQICAQTQTLSPFTVAFKKPTGLTVTSSGFLFSRATQTFNGTLTVKNTSSASVAGPIEIIFMTLASGVSLVNASGITGGNPFINVPGVASLAPGQSAYVNVQFKDPSNAPITFSANALSGSF